MWRGWYAVGLADDQMFNVNLGWQSVPVHTQNPEDDIVSQGAIEYSPNGVGTVGIILRLLMEINWEYLPVMVLWNKINVTDSTIFKFK